MQERKKKVLFSFNCFISLKLQNNQSYFENFAIGLTFFDKIKLFDRKNTIDLKQINRCLR